MTLRPEKRQTLARKDTAIVIEGFSRSANTHSVAAFIVANGPGLHVGRHLHGAPHLLRAARLGVPAVLLIRDPRDAIMSYLVRRPTLTPADAALEYLDFYRTAWRARQGFVVAVFDEAVSDFGTVIDEVNTRFGTTFRRFEPTTQNKALALELVEEMNRLECRGDVVESHVGRPSVARERAKLQLVEKLREPRVVELLATADQLYQRYRQLTGSKRDRQE
ncbi:MAG TPA: hypothetical protein VFG72_01165 [Marmoricola sp.]|nr:hypothetical protein [Marmoricola sp.]